MTLGLFKEILHEEKKKKSADRKLEVSVIVKDKSSQFNWMCSMEKRIVCIK